MLRNPVTLTEPQRYLNVQRSAGIGKSQHQTTWRVFVIRVFFNDHRPCPRLPKIQFAYFPLNQSPGNVQCKVYFGISQLPSNSV